MIERIPIGENVCLGVAERFRDCTDVDGIPPEERLGVLGILVQRGSRLDIKIAIQQVQDMTLIPVLLNEFRRDKPEFIRLGNLTIELA